MTILTEADTDLHEEILDRVEKESFRDFNFIDEETKAMIHEEEMFRWIHTFC